MKLLKKRTYFARDKYFENANLKALATVHERDFGISYLYSNIMIVCFIFFLYFDGLIYITIIFKHLL